MANAFVKVEKLVEFDGFLVVCGWAFDETTKAAPNLSFYDGPSGKRLQCLGPHWSCRPDVAEIHSLASDRVGFRAALRAHTEESHIYDAARLEIHTASHTTRRSVRRPTGGPKDPIIRAIDTMPAIVDADDPSYRLMNRFLDEVGGLEAGAVLEIGSRARSGHSRRELVAQSVEYVGLDVIEAPGVDVVGDAHSLSQILPNNHFTHAFSVSVWEHLLAPWKVSIELNAVLRVGGDVMISTAQSWPVHDEPSDYWRFSEWSWKALFNKSTGFEIIETAMGIPGSVVSHVPVVGTGGLGEKPAFLSSSVRIRKIGPATVDWAAPAEDLGASIYPA